MISPRTKMPSGTPKKICWTAMMAIAGPKVAAKRRSMSGDVIRRAGVGSVTTAAAWST